MTTNNILSYYEDFTVYKTEFCINEAEFFDYVSTSSIHSGITTWAYGTALKRRCIRISDKECLKAIAKIPFVNQRFWVKIICCLEEWQTLINDITITINGELLFYGEKELIENVNLGWPALYYSVSKDYFVVGDNEITVSTQNSSKAGFLVSEIDIIALPEITLHSQISALEYAKIGSTYSVAFSAPKDTFLRIENESNCELIGYKYFDGDYCVIQLKSRKEGEASCNAVFNEKTVEAILPQIIDNNDFCLVGIDCDDHRHDVSDEADRIIKIFEMTSMGNYFQFRPQFPRNYYSLAPDSKWQERVEFLKSFGTKIGVTDFGGVIKFVPELAGDNYFLSHIHEPYLFYNLKLEQYEFIRENYLHDSKAVLACESFAESEMIYRDILHKRKNMLKAEKEVYSVGSPSLLSIYERDASFDYITIEPVSNINLLTGSIRNVSVWGAHIPIDWYFGMPNDSCKSRKFRLAMQYLYLNGVSYVYPENATFKTNAFSREDWESEFCRTNRKYLREFYAYTVKNPRIGELITDKAVIYGRHEHFLWHSDDRIAELDEKGDWDSKVWGKWTDKHRKCWRAIDAWLPLSEYQNTYEAPVNKNLFSGTPYGNVDIVSYKNDWSKYKTIVFLGWNTMDDELLYKLQNYVKNGGTAVISYCHFNMTDRNDREMVFPEPEKLVGFLGVSIRGEFIPSGEAVFDDMKEITISSKVNSVLCDVVTAKKIAVDQNGNGIIFQNNYGEGVVYFGAFKEYFCESWSVEAMKKLLADIGENGSAKCDNPNISFTQRKLPDGRIRFDFLNMNCALENNIENFHLKYNNQNIKGQVKEGEIYSLILEKG